MSLSLAQDVQKEHPELYQTNIAATCYQSVVYLLEKLRARGHSAYLVCKTRGEGQYTPPGFVEHEITGFDGKKYWCTGVSHDAVWCDGLQFDTVGRGNDSNEPIFDGRGERITGVPSWNPIPKEYWRPNNVPLLEELPPTKPEPPPQPRPDILPKGEAYAALKAIDAFYRAPEGLQRPEGLGDTEGMAQWFYQVVIERVPLEAVLTQIRNSDEWRAKHR